MVARHVDGNSKLSAQVLQSSSPQSQSQSSSDTPVKRGQQYRAAQVRPRPPMPPTQFPTTCKSSDRASSQLLPCCACTVYTSRMQRASLHRRWINLCTCEHPLHHMHGTRRSQCQHGADPRALISTIAPIAEPPSPSYLRSQAAFQGLLAGQRVQASTRHHAERRQPERDGGGWRWDVTWQLGIANHGVTRRRRRRCGGEGR